MHCNWIAAKAREQRIRLSQVRGQVVSAPSGYKQIHKETRQEQSERRLGGEWTVMCIDVCIVLCEENDLYQYQERSTYFHFICFCLKMPQCYYTYLYLRLCSIYLFILIVQRFISQSPGVEKGVFTYRRRKSSHTALAQLFRLQR